MYRYVKLNPGSGKYQIYEGSDYDWAVRKGFVLKECAESYFGQIYVVDSGYKDNILEVKDAHKALINSWRDEKEQGGFEFQDNWYDSDPVSCQRIFGAALAASNAGDEFKITWTCQDNSTVELTAKELVGLANALAGWSNYCHQKASQLKAQVEDATSVEAIKKITWGDD